MRQRFAIWFILPCLFLAWPTVSLVRAQVSGLLAPGDPETIGARKDAKTAAQAKAAQAAGQPAAPEQPAAAPGGKAAAPDAAAPAEAAAPAAPVEKLDKFNDAHSNAMRKFKKGF